MRRTVQSGTPPPDPALKEILSDGLPVENRRPSTYELRTSTAHRHLPCENHTAPLPCVRAPEVHVDGASMPCDSEHRTVIRNAQSRLRPASDTVA